MNNENNFISLDVERIKEIVRDRLNIEPYNIGVCTEYKNTITIFNDRLIALKHNNFYALVPKSYRKDIVNNKWLYDISDFKIYCITKDYVDMNNIDINEIDPNKITSVKLDNKTLVYCSKEGVKKMESLDELPFTPKQIACLYLRIPKSGAAWLDSLIREANNRDNIN